MSANESVSAKGGDNDRVQCPHQSYSITVAMCRSRQQRGFSACRRCRHRLRRKRSQRSGNT